MKANYELLKKQLAALIADERKALPAMANASALLFSGVHAVSWAGFYLAEGNRLLLGPFQGKPACVSIAFGKGVCGLAAQKRKSVIVGNVHKFPGHIACDAESKSEIVIPVIQRGTLVGVLDLDSDRYDSFDEGDRLGLEGLVEVLAEKTDFTGLTEV
ncbi:MAG: GAF domain-containing protein [Eubacteriales bacterium]|nr:GAF domain-containing protein [Eubacteriales bacterium]MDD3881944.1 GAF domain-containing protein [Eubacteriales bacterium]MDD4513815.1 GAF domain-containing protein [Eubacteriales bacterium]